MKAIKEGSSFEISTWKASIKTQRGSLRSKDALFIQLQSKVIWCWKISYSTFWSTYERKIEMQSSFIRESCWNLLPLGFPSVMFILIEFHKMV